MMAGDHLTARQRASAWWAQHDMSTTAGFHTVSQNVHPVSSDIWGMPRHQSPPGSQNTAGFPQADQMPGQAGLPMYDTGARLYTHGGTPDKTKGLLLECVYATNEKYFHFFGAPWYRNIVMHTGPYGFKVGIELAPYNDSTSDTDGRATMVVGDGGGVWSPTTAEESKRVINDGLPHHLAVRWLANSPICELYVDGYFAQTRTYSTPMADLSANAVYVSADKHFTHCSGSVSHVCSGPDPGSSLEIVQRANLTPNSPRPLPTFGRAMGWDPRFLRWTGVKGLANGSQWKKVT